MEVACDNDKISKDFSVKETRRQRNPRMEDHPAMPDDKGPRRDKRLG